ncbi:hypothetical protein [Flavobacterium collinsii]|jgi:hypothetical protein|uniref:DUF4468 domain-containing protein n=1 Tax=Flavobacterium collinsii TaxID=1114861 RepID=A0A9W4TE96_9FLAO|nr:hypothetical protein [Flavobacterium collinsii]GIQ58665.1 hypothetical protein Flavo103_18010 [Flavobacterium collinsii]CAA9200556.1 hypothetical protein FLACOL7796_03323 [Flavobacterium collinsii]CAI2765485.1 conserved exported protein of unknown function [Flavobacterium collinsii]
MRIKFLLLAFLTSVIGFSQSVNDYKAVIVPLKYDFLKTENQYRTSTMTKANLNKAGFQAFYANEVLPEGFGDRCDLLYADVKKESGFLITKLFVEFKDCYGKVIFTSAIGKSKEKEYETAYRECLDLAFVSINALRYKYSGKSANTAKTSIPATPLTASAVATKVVEVAPVADMKDPNLLYAQPTENGYQLIDKTPKVVMKLLKTSRPDSFIAIKDGVQGSLNAKDNQWFFEYYKNDQLVSEKISVKF